MQTRQESLSLKYYSPEQLKELRKELDAVSDQELERRLESVWMNDRLELALADGMDAQAVWNKIDARVGSEDIAEKKRLGRWLRIAAVLLLPVLTVTSLYWYREARTYAAVETVVGTEYGDRVTVNLPDGTAVTLNESSVLRYRAGAFDGNTREVRFDGEAYFNVKKDADRPFVIHADGLSVKVLGTRFNLLARSTKHTAELSLEKGSVVLTSLLSGLCLRMSPSQKVVLDKSTGTLALSDVATAVDDAMAWKRNEFVFRNEPLRNVLKTLEESYGIAFRVCKRLDMDDFFTGVMPRKNLHEDLKILEESYKFKTEQRGGDVLIK